MPRRIDHLVICVRDLAQAELNLRSLGFTLTPTGIHPFGTSFHGALHVVEVVMSAPEPAAHRGFLERMTESAAELAPGRLTIGETGNRITVLSPVEISRRLPGLAADGTPRFCAARLAVAELDATKRELQRNGVDVQVSDGVLSTPPAASHGLALEFVEQGTV